MINIACVGAGAWGKNLVRNFATLPGARLVYCCDLDEAVLRHISSLYPGCKVTTSYKEVVKDSAVDAIVIATPSSAHYSQALQALQAGKHTYVEKPLTLDSSQAEELVSLASEKRLKLMVGHLLLYHPAIAKLKELVDAGELGEVYYLYSQRTNLGRIRSDESALWSFAPHDISVAIHLLGKEPQFVSADGQAYLQAGIEDVVFVTMHFPGAKMAHIQVSWLDPHKVRRITVVGSRKMVVFDDIETMEKLKVYDKGARVPSYDSYGDSITLRFGDIYSPRIDMTEPLRLECQHFLDCIRDDRQPLTDGVSGLQVVRALEKAEASLRAKLRAKSIGDSDGR